MTPGRARLLALAAYPLAPYLWLQGQQLRRRIPQLPEAAGSRQGSIQGDGHPITLVVMGESTAAGVGVATQAEGLAALLAAAVARETGRTVFWHTVAASGLTGICGSGIIEAVAEMRMAGIVDPSGLIGSAEAVGTWRCEPEGRTFSYVLHDGSASGGPKIAVTQGDIRAIQLAKSALYAGARLLMDELAIDRVDRVVLAGAFGAHCRALAGRPIELARIAHRVVS